jgi:hypothetical protein
MTDDVPILFVIGPSGVGKTKLGQWVSEDLKFLWIEVDRFPEGDGIALADLRTEWHALWNECQAHAIATTLRARVLSAGAQGAVVTFPSLVVFSAPQLAALEEAGIRLLVLYGTAQDCLAAFLKREKESGRNLSVGNWLLNNSKAHKLLGDPSYQPYRLEVFQSGQRPDRLSLMADVKNRLR